MAVELFPAIGVVWIVDLPTELAAETIWPDMEWIEALVSVHLAAAGEPAPGSQAREEVRAA